MQSERRIFKNTFFLAAGKIGGDIFTFVFLSCFGRYFGVEILGKYAFAMSLGGIGVVFISFGLNRLAVREISKNHDLYGKYMGNLLLMRGLFSLLLLAAVGVWMFYSSLNADTKMFILIILIYHIFYNLSGFIESGFFAHEEMQYPALFEIFHRLFIVAFGVLTLFLWKNPLITLSMYPLSTFFMFLMSFWNTHSNKNEKDDRLYF